MLRIQGNAVLAAVLMVTVVQTSPLPAQTPCARITEMTPAAGRMPQPSARPADAGPEFGAARPRGHSDTVPVMLPNSVLPLRGWRQRPLYVCLTRRMIHGTSRDSHRGTVPLRPRPPPWGRG